MLINIWVFLCLILCSWLFTFSLVWIFLFWLVAVSFSQNVLLVVADGIGDVMSVAVFSSPLRTMWGHSFSSSYLNILITATINTSVSKGSLLESYRTTPRRIRTITQSRQKENPLKLNSLRMRDGFEGFKSPVVSFTPAVLPCNKMVLIALRFLCQWIQHDHGGISTSPWSRLTCIVLPYSQ